MFELHAINNILTSFIDVMKLPSFLKLLKFIHIAIILLDMKKIFIVVKFSENLIKVTGFYILITE